MNNIQKLKKNTTISFLGRIATLISGLILPRYILLSFGSEIYGLTSSINQFLSIITFLELGVGPVVQSALYKPISEKNVKQASMVYLSAKRYFNKIAYALIFYVLALIIFYPLILNTPINFVSTAFLISALSVSLFSQYFFGIVNELFLNADQKMYVQTGSSIVVVILNLIVSIFLINLGYSIQIVKLASGIIYLLRPIYLSHYVNKHYNLEHDTKIVGEPLLQKWNGMGQHIAYTIQNSTDITVLTIYSTLENVSIFNIYNMVISAVKLLLSSLTSGITPFFGDLLARKKYESLNYYFSKLEWILHTGSLYIYGMTAVLITEFVEIYTTGIDDANYYAPIFSVILVLANMIYSIRIPYRLLIFASGSFKETQNGSFIEAGINIIISVLLVHQFGLVGVAIGTLISLLYHTIYLVTYLSKNILRRPTIIFLKYIFTDTIIFLILWFSGRMIVLVVGIITIINWFLVACIIGIVYLPIIILVNYVFHKDHLNYLFLKIKENITSFATKIK